MAHHSPAVPARRTATGLLVATFTLLAVVTATQTVLARRAAGETGAIGATIFFSAAIWLSWLLLLPGVVWLGRRFDFRPGRRNASAVVHLLAAMTAHILTMLLSVWLGVRLYNPEESITWEMIERAVFLSSRLPLSFLTYGAILVLDRALGLLHDVAQRDVATARLEAQATRARLDALAARLHPHFLFNALQSVSALVDEDPARARTMLAQIGDLLRDVLATGGDAEVSLEEELGLLGRYLAIEEVRFADRLRVVYDLAPDVGQVRVPRFLLQPLVENALRHGLAPLPAGGTLGIHAVRHGHRVTITIWNDGLPLDRPPRDGVGLATTRERLAARHGAAATLALRPRAQGVETVVELPA